MANAAMPSVLRLPVPCRDSQLLLRNRHVFACRRMKKIRLSSCRAPYSTLTPSTATRDCSRTMPLISGSPKSGKLISKASPSWVRTPSANDKVAVPKKCT